MTVDKQENQPKPLKPLRLKPPRTVGSAPGILWASCGNPAALFYSQEFHNRTTASIK